MIALIIVIVLLIGLVFACAWARTSPNRVRVFGGTPGARPLEFIKHPVRYGRAIRRRTNGPWKL